MSLSYESARVSEPLPSLSHTTATRATATRSTTHLPSPALRSRAALRQEAPQQHPNPTRATTPSTTTARSLPSRRRQQQLDVHATRLRRSSTRQTLPSRPHSRTGRARAAWSRRGRAPRRGARARGPRLPALPEQANLSWSVDHTLASAPPRPTHRQHLQHRQAPAQALSPSHTL